jgi:hypothetical protein
VTVLDSLTTGSSPDSYNVHFRHRDDFATSSDPDVYVLRAVKNDPFVTISEIQAESAVELGRRLGWWQVFRILRKNSLLRKKSRFRYAWGRS